MIGLDVDLTRTMHQMVGELRFVSPSGSQLRDTVIFASELVSGDAHHAIFESTATFPQYSEPGTWHIEWVFLFDKLSNWAILSPEDLATQGINTTLEIVGEGDSTPPQLVNLQFTPTSIDTSTGEQVVTITWEITDDLTGWSNGQLRFTSPSWGQLFLHDF